MNDDCVSTKNNTSQDKEFTPGQCVEANPFDDHKIYYSAHVIKRLKVWLNQYFNNIVLLVSTFCENRLFRLNLNFCCSIQY